MKWVVAVIAAVLVAAAPTKAGRCIDVHPWNRIAEPWQTEKAFWRFHYIKLRFPNFAAMEVPENPDGALPWKVSWEDRRGKRHERTITWKGGLATRCEKVCVLTVSGEGPSFR